MDGTGLRERRPKEPDKDHNDDMQPHLGERKNEKTFGRTPDGTGESIIYCFMYRCVELVNGFIMGKTSHSEG